jgi:pimeloyl-ACP methyl ester carboxylesterase
MVRRRTLGLIAFASAAAAGAAVGWAGERRTMRGRRQLDGEEWAELRNPVAGEPAQVTALDGTRLHADILGPPDAPTIVLAHGYAMAIEFWHYQRRDLAGEFRIVSYDQRGHGRSQEAAGGDYRAAALGQDLAAVLAATVPPGERAVVVGHSMGGMSILAFAEQCPELVERRLAGAVIANSTGSDVLAGAAASAGLAALTAVRRRALSGVHRVLSRRPGLADRVYPASSDLSSLITRAVGLSPNASSAHVAFTEQLVLASPSSVIAALFPTVSTIDLLEAAANLTVPTLVVAGERDRLTPIGKSHECARVLPKAELVVLPEVGHMAPLEAHEAFTDQLRRFTRHVLGGDR